MITTHILDTSRGQPAAGVPVRLEQQSSGGTWKQLGGGVTDSDGRLGGLPAEDAGTYRLTFETRVYAPEGLYPEVAVTFEVRDAGRHYHIPLLLSPYGYTTYRGS
jgi:5-hydroxyisourate hydrolase